MAYRDELEAAQARVRSLERELADVSAVEEAKSLALVKVGPTALARSEAEISSANAWLGAPIHLSYSRVLEGEIPESAHTELVEKMRTAMGNVGTTTVLPGSLAWTTIAQNNSFGPFVSVYVTYRDGKTSIRGEQKLSGLAGGIFGGVGGGVGGGGIFAPIALAWVNPLLIPVGLIVWFGGTYWSCRKLYRRSVRKHARVLEQLVVDLVEIAEAHVERATET